MSKISRRGLMGAVAPAAAIIGLGLSGSATATPKGDEKMKNYTLSPLPYPVDALEPYLDAKTLTIHHDKHHQGYVNGLNQTLDKLEAARGSSGGADMQALLRSLAFNGSGHILHTLYWGNLAPKPKNPSGKLLEAINGQFGSVKSFTDQLAAASKTAAGSGWGIAAYEPLRGRLLVLQIEKHENQMFTGAVPILALDVWEHAYYLKYQNNRGEYVDNIIKILNWDEIGNRFNQVSSFNGPIMNGGETAKSGG